MKKTDKSLTPNELSGVSEVTQCEAQLLSKRLGECTVYVFKNLENNILVTVTDQSNSGEADLIAGTKGVLVYEFIKVGKETVDYKFTGNYLRAFTPTEEYVPTKWEK